MTIYCISFTNRYGFHVTLTCYSRCTATIQAAHLRRAGHDASIQEVNHA